MKSTLIDYLLSPVTALPGVSGKTYEALQRIGCNKVADLLFHFPTRIASKQFNPIMQLTSSGTDVVAQVTIVESLTNRMNRVNKVVCQNIHQELINLVFFQKIHPYIQKLLVIGAKIVVSGRAERDFKTQTQIAHPKIYRSIDKVSPVDVVYPQTYDLSSYRLHNLINIIINRIESEAFPEWLDYETLQKHGWHSWLISLKNTHNPKSMEDISLYSPYRQRLIFDEFLSNQIAVRLMRRERERAIKGQALKFTGALAERLLSNLPFALTPGQNAVLNEIILDQRSDKKMARLLQGDVGSGKTIVALCAMLNAIEAGKQTVIMAPTDILANQHMNYITKFLHGLDLRAELLVGKTKKANRREILEALSQGSINILIGTHALFQQSVKFKDLGLIVIDEQHKFGVQQRIDLISKGNNCDVLAMSATPIPRTLSLAVYGDMDVSVIKDKPLGRAKIVTYAISDTKIDQVVELIRKKLALGEQIYWVCPTIEHDAESDNPETDASAKLRFEHLCKIFANDVGLMHGKLKPQDKDEVMQNFVSGKIKILVATTVIEVGIDVANATLLIVEQPERFGLAQLHQLRGRIGRSTLDSMCILLFSYKIGLLSKQRLQVMKESDDGFYIAEQDFKLRGGGEILGTKQSGLPEFKTANLEEHYDLLLEASCYANKTSHDNLDVLLKLFGYDINMTLINAS